MKAIDGTARLFFALWPDAATASLLEQLGKKWNVTSKGRITHLETLHMTVIFLGDIALSHLNELKSIACKVQVPEFKLNIAQSGCWQHNRIAWAAPENKPAALYELVGVLSEKLKEAQFALDDRNYVPHVTLIRNANCQQVLPKFDAFQWEVKEFVLVKSVKSDVGAKYEVIDRWPLVDYTPPL